MANKRTKPVRCMLTPERHAAFKIACIRLDVTIDQWLTDAVGDAIVRASLMPDSGRLPQKGDGDG